MWWLWWLAGIGWAEPASEKQGQPEPKVTEVSPSCAWSFGAMAGAYGTGSSTTWETVGGAAWEATASPAIAANCTFGKGPLLWWGGAETAPFYVHVRPDGLKMRQFATASAGFLANSGVWSFGPYVTGGFTAAGGGLRAYVTVPRDPARWRHRLELRITAYALGSPGIQGAFFYSVLPRRRR